MTMLNPIKKSKHIFTVIDIGSSKISCLIGKKFNNNDVQVQVLGFGQQASFGISNGLVTNMQELAKSIARAVETAETMAGFSIEKVVCSLSGGNPLTKITRNTILIENNSVEKQHLEKILKINNNITIENYSLLSSSPIKYMIDSNNIVENPIGMHTKTLTVEISNILGNKAVIQNITSAIKLCHLLVDKFIITPEASGIATMIKDERDDGAIIIDLGENITSIGLFIRNKIIFSDSIPIGGVHITSDIVRGLGTKAPNAEKIKIIHGSAQANELDEFTNLQIQIISEDGEMIEQQIPRALLTAIIRPRIEEIFEIIHNRLIHFNLNSSYVNKIVLTGGGANLTKIKELAEDYFKCNVRIGKPIGLIGLPEIAQNPSFSCLAGLLIKSLEIEKTPEYEKNNFGIHTYFGKIGNWFNENL
ncbi:MAG: cell division protein FtsA [Candidatus Puniceispirillales bacterium]|jgi:cell division protein FtsA|tara:strand:- start:1346 stop:2602 length:1257 start_codon:yes stop_codon:yes gene_type:complete